MTGNSTDVFTAEQRSAVMRRVKGRDTSPELALRKLLTRLGYRYRLHRKDLPGQARPGPARPQGGGLRARLLLARPRLQARARQPKANADYWTAKIARNRARDARVQAELTAMGWRPLVVWECELKDAEALAARLDRSSRPDEESALTANLTGVTSARITDVGHGHHRRRKSDHGGAVARRAADFDEIIADVQTRDPPPFFFFFFL